MQSMKSENHIRRSSVEVDTSFVLGMLLLTSSDFPLAEVFRSFACKSFFSVERKKTMMSLHVQETGGERNKYKQNHSSHKKAL